MGTESGRPPDHDGGDKSARRRDGDGDGRRGLNVPENVAIAGWDDGPDAEQKGLTTIAQSLFDQGRTCALVALGDRGPSRAVPWTATVRTSTR